jgi:ABC-2 type transport system permease protein
VTNVFLILKHEIQTILSKRSFWVMTFIFPAAILGLNFGTQIISERSMPEPEEMIPTGDLSPIGYVDFSGIIQQIPPQIPAGLMVDFTDETSAQSALQAGELLRYFVIPADFIESGSILQVEPQFNIFQDMNTNLIQYLITYNLLGDDVMAEMLAAPVIQVDSIALEPATPAASDEMTSFLVPFAVLFIFFMVITMSSGFMLQSVTGEKENRTAEVLLLSLRPRDLMLGKILGLSVIALFQMSIWLGAGLIVLGRASDLWDSAAAISLPPGFILWALLYFILGFLLYGSLMGAIGTLAPNAREVGSITFIVLSPLMLPLMLNFIFINAPDSPLATALSLFPLTAPVAMATRLVSGQVPTWQLLLGLLSLAITTYLVILLSARFFRADTLLSIDAFDWKKVLSALRS